ncbi:MAG: caspase family protein [Thermodesulfobacteriota bacterium]
MFVQRPLKSVVVLGALLALCVWCHLDTKTAFAADNCDKAYAVFSKGRFGASGNVTIEYYLEAIQLCPGFIRPYELVGYWHQQKGEKEKAVAYFNKAAELGTTNHKLYYLLAGLLFEKGDVNGASKNLNKALGIRGDYREALDLKAKIGAIQDKEGPEIILFEPDALSGAKVVHKDINLTVRGLANDKSGISWVKINGIEAPLDAQGNFVKDIPIQKGTNTITVEAADFLDNRARISFTIEGEEHAPPVTAVAAPPKQPQALYGKSFAVVIGVNAYEKWPALEFAAADAKAVTQRLEANGFEHITLILDKQATQRRILTEFFDGLPKKVGPRDRLVFYFAGHGQTEDLPGGGKRGYIIPVDGDTSDYASTAISMAQIRSLSSHISAKHILYVTGTGQGCLFLHKTPVHSQIQMRQEPRWLSVAIPAETAGIILRLEPLGKMDAALGRVLENKVRRRLAAYQLADRVFRRKCGMTLTEFEATRVVEKRSYSHEVESDHQDWDQTVDGIRTMGEVLTELLDKE